MDRASNPILSPKIGSEIAPGTLAEPEFRELVAKVLKQSPKDRPRVAVELSALTGERITVRMLNDWLAPSKAKVRFPASFVRALCEVLGDTRIVRLTLPENLKTSLAVGENVTQSLTLLRQVLSCAERLTKDTSRERLQRRSKR